MHRVFGMRGMADCLDREGVYFIPCHGHEIGVVQTPKGYFFVGGGLENRESHLDCIGRECLEEVGYLPDVRGRLCSAEAYILHPMIGNFHPIQTYYWGKLLDMETITKEPEHNICWIEYDRLKGMMFLDMQNWALEQLSTVLKEDAAVHFHSV